MESMSRFFLFFYFFTLQRKEYLSWVDGDIQVQRGHKHTSSVVKSAPSLSFLFKLAHSGVPIVVRNESPPIGPQLNERSGASFSLWVCPNPQFWLIIKSFFYLSALSSMLGLKRLGDPPRTIEHPHHAVGYPVTIRIQDPICCSATIK